MVRVDRGGAARAGGLGALIFILAAPGAFAASVRVVEGESMRVVSGSVVRAQEAVGGRAARLPANGVATARFTSDNVGSVVVRARALGCRGRRRLTIVVDGGTPYRVKPRGSWREQRVALTLAAGAHRIRVSFSGSERRRCRVLVDRVRLPAPKGKPVATPAPVAPAAPASPLGRYVPLGAAVQLKYIKQDAGFDDAFKREFVSMTPENEMKMEWLQPERGRWNFTAADALVAHARAYGKDVRGHALIFGTATPPWVKRILLSHDAAAAMRTHIHTVMRRYRDSVREWDVVNEALGSGGTYRSNAWTEKLGSQYVEMAFRYAREADPTAKLVYNEFDADTAGPKRDATAGLVRKLKDKGLVDAVGLQMHRSLADAPTREQLEETMRIYEQMGVEVQVTEMDVLAGGAGSLTDRLIIQAEAYRRAAQACAAVAACTRFTVWGVTDRYSWMGVDQLPLLLDAGGAEKPALAAVREVLGG